jgi:hypothetical protein
MDALAVFEMERNKDGIRQTAGKSQPDQFRRAKMELLTVGSDVP